MDSSLTHISLNELGLDMHLLPKLDVLEMIFFITRKSMIHIYDFLGNNAINHFPLIHKFEGIMKQMAILKCQIQVLPHFNST